MAEQWENSRAEAGRSERTVHSSSMGGSVPKFRRRDAKGRFDQARHS
jgi:hypothetical protein